MMIQYNMFYIPRFLKRRWLANLLILYIGKGMCAETRIINNISVTYERANISK